MVTNVTRTGKVSFHGIPDAVLRRMNPSELNAEAERVSHDLAKNHRNAIERGSFHAASGELTRERRCLLKEQQRVQKEIDRRRLQLAIESDNIMPFREYHIVYDRAMDADEYAKALEA